MTILHVRAALADEHEAHRLQHATDLARLEKTGGLGIRLRRDGNILGAYKLGVELRLAVLQEHRNHFAEITL